MSHLFEFEIEPNSINGVQFDGEKRGFPVKIFNYMKYTDSAVDELFIQGLSESLGSKIPTRIYCKSIN